MPGLKRMAEQVMMRIHADLVVQQAGNLGMQVELEQRFTVVVVDFKRQIK